MWVRSLCTHYKNGLHVEGEEFEHTGALHKHIVAVKKPAADEPQQGETTSRAMKPAKA